MFIQLIDVKPGLTLARVVLRYSLKFEDVISVFLWWVYKRHGNRVSQHCGKTVKVINR
jgi:hypothetical protein